MKTNLENLTSLLCEVEEVNKQIKELKFWTLINVNWIVWKFLKETAWWITQFFDNSLCYYNDDTDNPEIKIIWNSIEYHHLMMYFEDKIEQTTVRFDMYWRFINEYWEVEFRLDITKPLHQQSEETLWKIFNFLKW